MGNCASCGRWQPADRETGYSGDDLCPTCPECDTCPDCDGEGGNCPTCHGTGRMPTQADINREAFEEQQAEQARREQQRAGERWA